MKQFEINLLPKKKNKVADRLLHFVLYYFRYIIVITQIVVIGVFFFRFRVDQQVIDLKEAFKQKQQILAVTIPIVEEAREVSVKADKVSEIITQQETVLARTSFLLKNLPEDTSLFRLESSDDSVTIEGQSLNVFSVRALHRKIALREGFESASITSIQPLQDGSFSFTIQIPFGENEKR